MSLKNLSCRVIWPKCFDSVCFMIGWHSNATFYMTGLGKNKTKKITVVDSSLSEVTTDMSVIIGHSTHYRRGLVFKRWPEK